jgi:broad specificity phosphatase PhoE
MGVVYIVRHGQASFGAEDYDELSELGGRQSTAFGHAIKGRFKPDVVVSGTLRRHMQTARACLVAMGSRAEIVEDGAWNEFDHQELLLKHEPLFADRAAMYKKLGESPNPLGAFEQLFRDAMVRWTAGHNDADYVETWPQFHQRCVGALDALITKLGDSRTALVFSSGGPISQVCGHLMGLTPERAMLLPATFANCGMTKIVYGRRGTYLSTLNEHGWFEGPNRPLLTYR